MSTDYITPIISALGALGSAIFAFVSYLKGKK